MTMALVQDPLNIIICGVGGQGNILASELLASALVDKGYFTTVGETYGASQRGGAVMSHVRVSERRQYGALIPQGAAHILVGFEPIETLRVARKYGSKRTRVILDSRPNFPLAVLAGDIEYPLYEAVTRELEYLCASVLTIDAIERAKEAGRAQAANILMMGALTALPEMPLQAEDYEQVLRKRFQAEVYELNRKVFNQGYELINNA